VNSKKFLPKLLLATALTVSSFSGYAQNLKAVGNPSMESPHVNPIALTGSYVYVTNTPSGTVDVIDRKTQKIFTRISVGVDPVSIAVRPDGKEIWVSNHVSDSVSVIDSDPKSPTFHVVVATIQEFTHRKATLFDEPVGIAFANNNKAYVALSSENQIAVVDVKTRKVIDRLEIRAQDPRAIFVQGDRLYVVPFESGNKTQLSGGYKQNIDGNLVTFDAWEHTIKNNNVLSLGYVSDIVKHPKNPDKDLFVFDTKTDRQIKIVETLGTLLYGLTVDSKGRIFITQTDARNDANGRAGTKKHGLAELQNRPYLNQITSVQFNDNGVDKKFLNLEPLPPANPNKDQALSTPYAIQISDDDSIIIASASSSDKIFALDSRSGEVLSQITVGAGPRGIALEKGKLSKAWIYNALDNTVTLLDVSNAKDIKLTTTITLEDPTHAAVKRGRIAFNSATVSSTGTFSCASCHPNGHSDQLLWVLDTPIVSGGNQIMPRLSMPVRGLRDTAPFHWDGTKGDPYGGINSANLFLPSSSNCKVNNPISCLRQLIDDNLATTMSLISKDKKKGALTEDERNDLAVYLLSVPYPPAPKRPYTNVVTSEARQGFSLFHVEGDINPKFNQPNVCGSCHRMPFLTSARTPGKNGMKAPTWRGAYDRHMILPQGRLNIIDFPWIAIIAEKGRDEKSTWQLTWSGDTGPRHKFDPVWDMVLEGSTGFSGTFARQVTVSKDVFDDTVLIAMESAASQGAVVLEADGAFIDNAEVRKVQLQFDPDYKGGVYVDKAMQGKYYSKVDLIRHAELGKFVGTFTARHGVNADVNSPQPALWTLGSIHDQRKQDFPTVTAGRLSMTISGRHFKDDAKIFVDGIRVNGAVSVKSNEKVVITLANAPTIGMHLLQVQVPDGLFSNDFIFYVKE
jgi:YVTN family beta-propeller protein